MRKLLLLLALILTFSAYSQKPSPNEKLTLEPAKSELSVKAQSKKAHIISVTGDYTEEIGTFYWKIEGDVITQYLNKKMTKVFDTYKIGIAENDDWKIKWSYDKKKNQLIKRGVDTFTGKTYKITYELTLIK